MGITNTYDTTQSEIDTYFHKSSPNAQNGVIFAVDGKPISAVIGVMRHQLITVNDIPVTCA